MNRIDNNAPKKKDHKKHGKKSGKSKHGKKQENPVFNSEANFNKKLPVEKSHETQIPAGAKLLKVLTTDQPLVMNIYGSSSLPIQGMHTDSRKIKKNNLFFALSGTERDGNKFITAAVQNGAVAVASEELLSKVQLPSTPRATYIQVQDISQFMAETAARFYDTTEIPIPVIGVTGTNGKTTTAWFINEALKAQKLKTIFLGTIGFEVCGRKVHTDFTTPPAPLLHQLIAEGLRNGARYLVMEVSSHALKLKRVWGMKFDIAIFTNLTYEHRELHPDMENYYETKKKLFGMLKPGGTAIINVDDDFGKKLADTLHGNLNIRTVGKSATDVKLIQTELDIEIHGQKIAFESNGRSDSMRVPLIGDYNAYNVLSARETLLTLGISLQEDTFEKLSPPDGRFNWFMVQGINVVIDFAHTPDGLEKLLKEARKLVSRDARMITLFGCPGSRDPSKRPLMGKIATELSDHVILTTDDIHFEEPRAILDGIVQGATVQNFEVLEDRREAIAHGLRMSKAGDFLVIAGRGHERFQYVKDEKIPFYDKTVVYDEAEKLRESNPVEA